ncbi:GNAT family N-acetyltransferase [Pseudoalteromonas sp. G4]|uniref:GNAT family N-acetyltransferase n=1 Tax=Pseudoalteromonas sp. G4 TaxID=2992761 RepID=UPI00237D583F|nr:GNAT family protein [Pseudoalteromonas sp. G4]MDE3270455.1 GNAT family N-acetyltransferase [Pseudoalteromonas sp. G4]
MPIQISPQIILRPLNLSDASAILSLVNLNRERLAEYLYWVEDVQCVDSAKQYIFDRVNNGLNEAHWFKIYFNNEICGVFAVKSVCPQTHVAELGYWLGDSAKGNGVISQIVNYLPKLLANTSANAIEFRCLEQNHASIKVALRAGANLVGSIPDFMVANGIKQNLNIYRVTL